VDPRAGLDDVEERKFLTLPELEIRPLGRPARSKSPYRHAIPAPFSSLYDHINLGLPTSTSWLGFFLSSWIELGLSPLGSSATNWTVVPAPDDRCAWRIWWNENWQGNRSTRRKPAPMPFYPPQIPHELGSNPGRRGGKPAPNRLIYGTALPPGLLWNMFLTTHV
jgi:hypothetical protein